jgi:hypothetical protein
MTQRPVASAPRPAFRSVARLVRAGPFSQALRRPSRSVSGSDGSAARLGRGPSGIGFNALRGGGSRRRSPSLPPEASAVIDWRRGSGAVGGDESDVMASKDNLHRETLRAALRVIQTAETLEQARIQLARMLNVFDKLEAQGIKGDAAVAEAEERLAITQAPKASAADERPVRRRETGRV